MSFVKNEGIDDSDTHTAPACNGQANPYQTSSFKLGLERTAMSAKHMILLFPSSRHKKIKVLAQDRLATMRHKDALSKLERTLLGGQVVHFDDSSLGRSLRYHGLIAIADGRDLEAVNLFRRSKDAFEPESLERAVSERLHGLALIRVQREVEGTFALERADPVLEREGYASFVLEETA
jgi:hypothetical protein